MPSVPLRFASLAIVGFLAVTAFDIATGLEHWPFGSYPMYSLVYSEQLYWLRLYGVTDRGEIPMREERDFAPFDEARLTVALQRLQGTPDASRNLEDALRNLMRIYNGRPAALPIRALRLYTVHWVLRPGMQGSEPPEERTLIAEARP
jgi:hypothetical protein